MPHCMVPGCTNGSKSTKGTGISYHRLPKDKHLSKKWLQKIRRENPPKRESCYVCSMHFTLDCFKTTLKHLMGETDKNTLKDGSVPTIFPHAKMKRQRLFSIQRRKNKDKEEVSQQSYNVHFSYK